MKVVVARDLVRFAVVVSAHLDDHQIRRLVALDVELLRVFPVHRLRPHAGVGRAVPEPGLCWLAVV